MKKLLIITDMFPDVLNPVNGIFVKQQVEELAKHYQVKVIATYFPAMQETQMTQESSYDLQYIYYPMSKKIFLFTVFNYLHIVLPQVKKIIQSYQPDMIHIHDCRHIPELFSLRQLLDKLKMKTYLTVHNIKTHPRNEKKRILSFIYKLLMTKAYAKWTHIFTVNETLKTDLIPYISKEKITVVHNGITETPISTAPIIEDLKNSMLQDKYKILSVGNLVPGKGFDLLIRAIRILKERNHDVHLVIVGDGAEKSHLQEQIKTYHLDSCITLIHRQKNEIVRNLYPLFDAFVLPSFHETFGIVYIEAMYAGLPTIGVRGQGIDGTIIHEKNGLLVQPKDLSDLVHNIENLINDPCQSEQIALAGQKTVKEKYMLSTILEIVIKIYES